MYQTVEQSVIHPSLIIRPGSVDLTQKTPYSRLAFYEKRTFPLNIFNNLKIGASEEIPAQERVPEFINDYMKEPNRRRMRAKSSLAKYIKYSTRKKPAKTPRENAKPKANKNEVPRIHYKDFKRKEKSGRSDPFYKPHVIHISNRSKMTLYSSVPMNIKPMQYKENRISFNNHSSSMFKDKSQSFRS